jgi:hypothetical protein
MQIQPSPAIAQQASSQSRRHTTLLIVVSAGLLLFVTAMSRSFSEGRLAAPITHNGVNYFIEGIRLLDLLKTQGFFALISNLIHTQMHAPISSYQAMLAFLFFGVTDWAPYATNILYAFIFLAFAAYLVRDCPPIVLVGVMAFLIGMPLASNSITEFEPEMVCSLFTAMGTMLLVQLLSRDCVLESDFSSIRSRLHSPASHCSRPWDLRSFATWFGILILPN